MKLRHLVSACLGLTVVACGTQKEASETKIVGGVFTSSHPEVVKLDARANNGSTYGVCTGVFVTKNALITTAHCVANETTVLVNGVSTKDISIHPQYDPNDLLILNRYDIAYVRFDRAMVQKPAALATVDPAIGDMYTVIGFGAHKMTFDLITGIENDGRKRMGTNVITEFSNGIFLSEGNLDVAVQGIDVSAGYGDSGAPAINQNGEVLGYVTSIRKTDGSESNIITTEFLSINSNTIRQFIQQNMAK